MKRHRCRCSGKHVSIERSDLNNQAVRWTCLACGRSEPVEDDIEYPCSDIDGFNFVVNGVWCVESQVHECVCDKDVVNFQGCQCGGK